MPIKSLSLKHWIKKNFVFEKGFEHYFRNRLRTVSKGVPNSKHGKDQDTRKFPNIEDYKVPRFCEIFLWDSDKPKYNVFWKILWQDFLKIYFGKIAFNFKILFKLLEISWYKSVLGWDLWKGFTRLQNRVQWEKIVFTYRFYFLKAQVFLFLIKHIIHGFFKKIAQMFLIIGFYKNKRVWASIEKRKPSLYECVWELSKLAYRDFIVPYILGLRSIVVRCLSFISLSSELSGCPNWEFGCCVTRS